MKLFVSSLITTAITIAFYWCEKKDKLAFLKNNILKQVIIGIIFGLSAVYSTELGGIQYEGAIMNARDAAPICAGLFFGEYAGIIAGFIGGLERFLCVYWGGGYFTRIACSVATFLAGLFAAYLRKYIFKGEKPKVLYSVVIGLIAEDVHMLLIFITNLKQTYEAYDYVQKCTIPMMAANIVALFMAFLAISFFDNGKEIFQLRRKREILVYLQQGMTVLLIVASAFTTFITVFVQLSITRTANERNMLENLNSGIQEITYLVDNDGLSEYDAAIKACDFRVVGDRGYLSIADLNGVIVNGSLKGVDISGIISDDNENKQLIFEDNGTDYFTQYVKRDDFYLVSFVPEDEAMFLTYVSIRITVLLETLIYAVLFLLQTAQMKRLVTSNMNQVNNDLEAITSGKLDTVLDVRKSTEFSKLSDEINVTVGKLKDLIEDAKMRMARELEIARTIQLSSLPTEFGIDDRLDIFATTIPAKEVGGDFYDVYKIDDEHLAILIADVSGKGIPAAMFMMRARTNLYNLTQSGLTVNEVFVTVNHALCHNNSSEMFITAWMGVLNITTGEIEYVNAGHNPPLVFRKEAPEYLHTKRNLVLAAMDDYNYVKGTMQLNPGDGLFLYTDGVTETTSGENELYGEERLIKKISSIADLSSENICNEILMDTTEFAGEGVEQFDDITMLMLKYLV